MINSQRCECFIAGRKFLSPVNKMNTPTMGGGFSFVLSEGTFLTEKKTGARHAQQPRRRVAFNPEGWAGGAATRGRVQEMPQAFHGADAVTGRGKRAPSAAASCRHGRKRCERGRHTKGRVPRLPQPKVRVEAAIDHAGAPLEAFRRRATAISLLFRVRRGPTLTPVSSKMRSAKACDTRGSSLTIRPICSPEHPTRLPNSCFEQGLDSSQSASVISSSIAPSYTPCRSRRK